MRIKALFALAQSLMVGLSILIITSCADNYRLKVNSLDYTGPQEKAVIQFSDPQLYKREALVNERRREREYLVELLEESKKQPFEPEFVRELELLSAFSGRLGVSFDPAKSIEFKRAKEIGDLEQEINVTRLQMQLAQVRRDLELLNQQLPEQIEPSTTPGQPGSPVTALPGGPPVPKDELNDMINRLDKLQNTLSERLGKEVPRPTGAKANPRDTFYDRQAYRAEIRSAINAVSLDELHDFGGNSLFRMQFQATVLPGNDLDKLGILRMRIKPPELDENSIDKVLEDLYLEWITHVNRRLNQPTSESTISSNELLLQLGATGEYFEIIEYQVPKVGQDGKCKAGTVLGKPANTKDCDIIRIAVPPGTRRKTIEAIDTLKHKGAVDSIEAALANAVEAMEYKGIGLQKSFHLSQEHGCAAFSEKKFFGREGNEFTNDQVLEIAREFVPISPLILTFLDEFAVLDPAFKDRLETGMSQFTRDAQTIRQLSHKFLSELRNLSEACADYLPNPDDYRRLGGGKIPLHFKNALFNKASNKFQAEGRVSVYEASPVGLVQRLSSAARAAQALDLAADIAASLPTQGVGAQVGLGYSRTASGKVDALERVPLVIGFSEPADGNIDDSLAGFGWLLGPKVVLDAEKRALKLEHNLAPYSLSADVSLPAWWPYFELNAQAAWAPNWRNESGNIMEADRAHLRTVRVPMRHNSGDLDALTSILATWLNGRRIESPEITWVEPSVVSACSKTVTFVVRGSNIWRGTEVYFNGIRGTDVKVLPDMAGISVDFDMSTMPYSPSAESEPKIIIWTNNGPAVAPVKITGERKSSTNCVDKPSEPAEQDNGLPRITKVFPQKISNCDPNPRFLVEGNNLEDVQDAYLGTTKADKIRTFQAKKGNIVEVEFKHRIKKEKLNGLDTLVLVVRTKAGVTGQDISFSNTNCE